MRKFGSVLIASALVVLTACGSSAKKSGASGDANTTSTPSTEVGSLKASFLAAANAECREMDAEITALGDTPEGMAAAADATDKTAKIVARTLQKLRSLPAPASDTAELAAIFAKVDVVLSDSANVSAALRANDESGADRATTKLETDNDAANAAATAYGLTDCAS